jgi:hypothetical protein
MHLDSGITRLTGKPASAASQEPTEEKKPQDRNKEEGREA